MSVLAVAAAHWWGPFGWLYRNCPGNLAASGICFVAGVFAGRAGLNRLHAKLDAHHAEQMAAHKATQDHL